VARGREEESREGGGRMVVHDKPGQERKNGHSIRRKRSSDDHPYREITKRYHRGRVHIIGANSEVDGPINVGVFKWKDPYKGGGRLGKWGSLPHSPTGK